MPLEIEIDYSGLEEVIGTVEGIADAVEGNEYMGYVIDAADAVATKEFDVDAAATAGPGNFSHVYEFGTVGITRGTIKFPDPTSSAARLYVHHKNGFGNVRNVFYTFRPAVAPNPRPSASFYGVPSSVIRMLSKKKYIFRNKAAVVEYGETVYIKPKEKPFNFVPFYGKPGRKYPGTYIFRPIEGHSPMASTPGEDSGQKGQFTAFWELWWMGRGQELMTGEANKFFNADITWLLEQASKGKQSLTNVMRYNSRGRVYNRRRRVKAKMIRQAKDRGKVTRA